MKTKIHYHNSCRLCKKQNLKRFLHFDTIPFADAFIAPDELGNEFVAPIDIYWCEDCKSVQTQHDVEIEEYYRDYHYTISASPFMQRSMQSLAEETFRRYDLPQSSSVIEIGSSDGLQLHYFQQLGAQVLGYEPSEMLTKVANENGVPTVCTLFTRETIPTIPKDLMPANVVLLIHTFDHLLDPLDFLQAIHEVIDPETGLLIIEVHNIDQIVRRMETFLFTHEHTTYSSALTMKRLLERTGFKLLATDLIPPEQRRINSLLVVAARKDSKYQPDPDLDLSSLHYLDRWETYADFERVVKTSYQNLRQYIKRQIRAGKRLAGYGCGGRGVMTLAMAALSSEEIAYVCDRNTNAHGLYTPYSHIPIVPPAHLKDDPVDEIIVFSFGYFDEIKEQIAGYIGPDCKLTSLLEVLSTQEV